MAREPRPVRRLLQDGVKIGEKKVGSDERGAIRPETFWMFWENSVNTVKAYKRHRRIPGTRANPNADLHR